MKIKLLIAILILLLGAIIRSLTLNYGLNEVCLTPRDEQWLYNPYQVPSLYATQTQPVARYDVEKQTGNPVRAIAPQTNELWLLRYLGILLGALVMALTIALAKHTRASWGLLASAFVAVAWWFVANDQLVVRYDGALLLVSIAVYILARYRQQPVSSIFQWVYDLCAVGLLVVAPPLWWLTLALILCAPKRDFSRIIFLVLAMLVLFPSLRNLYQWVESAFLWDIGLTATLIWLVLALALFHARRLSLTAHILGWLGILVLACITLTNLLTLPQPNETEWQLVRELQNQLADNSLVEFDKATGHLADVIACPMQANIVMQARGQGSILSTLPFDYQVTTTQPTDTALHTTDLGNGYFLVRNATFPNALNLPFADQVRLLGYQLSASDLPTQQPLDIRFDWQLMNTVSEQITVYAGFIHITQPNQPAEKVYETTFRMVDLLGDLAPRANHYNRHFWLSLPARVPNGTYDVVFGVYQTIEGREIGRITLGQINVVTP